MSNQPAVHIFTKSNCVFCSRAKSLFKYLGLDYVEHDIEKSTAIAAASKYYSGRVTAPQIFIGRQHVNGAEDLEALHKAGLLQAMLDKAEGEIILDPSHEEDWITGSKDFTLASAIDKVDLSKQLDDPENLLILNFYKGFFGFTPISYLYLAVWPQAYKSCALSNVIATFPALLMLIGEQGVTGVTYTASNTQGCTYCTVHTVARDGTEQTDAIKHLQAARDGSPGHDNPFSPLDVAMVELAEQATLNTVTDEQISKVTALAKAASKDPQSVIEGVGLGAEIMSLLNIFNDLLNVEIEGDMAKLAVEELGLDSGRHATSHANPDDLNFDLPYPELTVETALDARREKVKDWPKIAQTHLGYIPGWLNAWPVMLKPLFAGMYTELMADGTISAELKHLMARTSAIAKGFEALAASSAISAHHVSKEKGKALERIRHSYAVATDQPDSDLFDAREKMALRFAWLSAQTPIVTPAQFVKPMTEHFTQRELVELCVACGMACAVQRMSAALQLKLNSDEIEFCNNNNLKTNILMLKYPITQS